MYFFVNVVIGCGPLVTPNGTTNGTLYVSGTVRVLTCDAGYTLQGDGVIRCEQNGQWNVTSTCAIGTTFSVTFYLTNVIKVIH